MPMNRCVHAVGFALVVGAYLLLGAWPSARPVVSAQEKADKGEAAKKALPELQGTWLIESAVYDGNECPKELVKKSKVTFAGDKCTEKPSLVLKDGKFQLGDGYTVPVQVDNSKTPKWIDFIVEFDGKKTASQGIYELKGDELKICYRGSAGDGSEPNRPTKFTSKAGAGLYLLVLKREGK